MCLHTSLPSKEFSSSNSCFLCKIFASLLLRPIKAFFSSILDFIVGVLGRSVKANKNLVWWKNYHLIVLNDLYAFLTNYFKATGIHPYALCKCQHNYKSDFVYVNSTGLTWSTQIWKHVIIKYISNVIPTDCWPSLKYRNIKLYETICQHSVHPRLGKSHEGRWLKQNKVEVGGRKKQ